MQDIYKDHKTKEMVSSVYAGIEGEIPNYQPRSETTSNKITLAELKPDVKPEVSKVLDENGEPLVVYHGTGERDISEFKRSESGALGAGIYFWDKEDLAEGHVKNIGGVVYSCFLNIKNPYIAQGPKPGGVEIMEKLQKNGNDGVVHPMGMYVVFEPNQIKSATANNGNFSLDSDNIYNQENKDAAIKEYWKQEGERFVSEVDKKADSPSAMITVCDTLLLLQNIEGLEIENLPLQISSGLAQAVQKPENNKNLHNHGITKDELAQIPYALQHPAMVLKSATQPGDIVVFTDIKDSDNRSVIVPIVLGVDKKGKKQNGVFKGKSFNVIKSIYGRNHEDAFILN